MQDRAYATWQSRPYGIYLSIHAAVAAAAREGRIIDAAELVARLMQEPAAARLTPAAIERALVAAAAAQGVPLVLGARAGAALPAAPAVPDAVRGGGAGRLESGTDEARACA
ncbi:hypothetical protein ACUN0C_01075 [Faunimonas sp. B44]|uniref:hypothetical protein n=1 Tax=Faunimonas sp. B44 TaxID=3461493 RepID=UPI004043F690